MPAMPAVTGVVLMAAAVAALQAPVAPARGWRRHPIRDRLSGSTHRSRPRSANMCAADELPPLEAVVIPDKLPSFGLTERERTRFSYMFRRDEPLFQEIFGLQVLLGLMGSHANGMAGLVIGVAQVGPFLSFIPGRAGNVMRWTGWYIFAGIISICAQSHGLWLRLASVVVAARTWIAVLRRGQDKAVRSRVAEVVMSCASPVPKDGARSRVTKAFRRLWPRRREWPAVGGSVKFHPRSGPWPPPPPREQWTPPPGWKPPAKPLLASVSSAWASGRAAPLVVTLSVDEALWPMAAVTAAADEALTASLVSAGIETTAEAIATRVAVLGATRSLDTVAERHSARRAQSVRTHAIQQEIEHQLITDGLDPAKLHLIGGDEPDEEASFFADVWLRTWNEVAESCLSDAVVGALELARSSAHAQLEHAAVGAITSDPRHGTRRASPRLAVDFAVAAAQPTTHDAPEERCIERQSAEQREVFEAALQRGVEARRSGRPDTEDAAEPAREVRWIHVGTHPSRDLALPKSLGARTIWLAHGAGADATSEARSSTGASLVDARVDGLIPDLAKALLSVAT